MFAAFAAVLFLISLASYYGSHYSAWDNTPEEMIMTIVITLFSAVAGVLEAFVVEPATAASKTGANVGYGVGVWICVLGILWIVLARILARKGNPRKFAQWLPYIGIGLLGLGFIAGAVFQFLALA